MSRLELLQKGLLLLTPAIKIDQAKAMKEGLCMDWIIWLLLVLGFFTAVYTVIPDLFLHRLGMGSWKRHYLPGVAITFDDGPCPETTPQILDILDAYQVKAVFFVNGMNAIRHPGLIQEIQNRGHRIGGHGMDHRYAWFISPRQTWREWDRCLEVLEDLSGAEIPWIRPPWGTFNLVIWLWMKRRQKRAVLWNAEGHDWQNWRSPAQIAAGILRRINEGAIIVLHETSDDPAAAANIREALKIICRDIVAVNKLPVLPLEFPAWSWSRRLIFRLWESWEHFFARRYHLQRINAHNFLRLAKTAYQGPDLFATDGRLLAKAGDQVAEIHIESSRLGSDEKDRQKVGLRILRQARRNLPELAQFVAINPEYQDMQVFFGVTLISRVVQGLGFHIQDLPESGFVRRVGVLQKVLRQIYHPGRGRFSGKKSEELPKLVWISRQELLNRWLPSPDEKK